ncbi:uncharacterized protein LOC144651630 isoform X2 [Oculina patagonica]
MACKQTESSNAASNVEGQKDRDCINVMFLCDEWKSSKGGLSTFNREFAVNLAETTSDSSIKVHCYVSQSDELGREDARQHGVNLITAHSIPGSTDPLDWLKIPPQELPDPDIVIGHGRKLGIPAFFLVRPLVSKCKWVHFVHVFCEDLGKYKVTQSASLDSIEENEKKHKSEIALCKAADVVVAVGSRLQQKYSRSLPNVKVEIITPGIISKFYIESSQLVKDTSVVKKFNVFMFGRATFEDRTLKGYDIIANAIGSLDKMFELTFVGSSSGEHRKIEQWFLDNTCISRNQLTIRSYCNEQNELKMMFYESDMVALPSRTEGFGLVALEAISAGIPVLVAGESGIAEALEKVEGGKSVIVESDDANEWAQRIQQLSNQSPQDREYNAKLLRENYNKTYSWSNECERFKRMIQDLVESLNALKIRIDVETIKSAEHNTQDRTPVMSRSQNSGPQGASAVQDVPVTSGPTQSSYTGAAVPQVPNFITTEGVLSLIASNYLLTTPPRNKEERDDFLKYMKEMRVIITDVQIGSLLITVKCDSLQILERLWKDYSSGHLRKVVQRCFVTEEILTELGLVELNLKTTILEQEYKACKAYFEKEQVRDQCESTAVLEGKPGHFTDEKILKETDDDLQTLTNYGKLKTERDEDDSVVDDEDENVKTQKKQAHRRRGRGASRERKKGLVPPSHRKEELSDSNQEQPPGRPFPIKTDHSSPAQHKARPIARGLFPVKTALDLKALREMDATGVVHRLNVSMARFKFFLRSPEEQHNSDEFIFDLTCILANACSAPPDENTNNILAALKDSLFWSSKIPRLLDRVQASMTLNDQRRLIQDLLKVFMRYLRHLPSSYADLPYDQLKRALEQSNIDRKYELQKDLESFKQVRDDIIKAERQKHGRRYINRPGKKPPNDFRDMPICPTNEEITSQERPFLRKNILKGRYEDAEHYLDVQFRLLREDFLEPLREGIHEIVHNVPRKQRNQLTKYYPGARIVDKKFTRSGIIYEVQFDVSRFDTRKWAHSKRLIFGSFLCISKDNFETMLFATVANRDPDELKIGKIDIRFIEEQDVFGIENWKCEYLMIESPAYYETYCHVLKGLKELDETTMPFKKYLVECSEDVDPPEYLRREDSEEPVCYDLSLALDVPDSMEARRVPVLQPEAWPSVETLPLNSSQLEALRTAVTTEFSLIQGPPGTGKTYVGAKIVRCLLENREAWDPEGISPMLMVFYTNHALDQFLEKVLEFLPQEEIIRVGGRCKSQQLEACNLKLFTKYKMHGRRRELRGMIQNKVCEMKRWNELLAKADKQLLEFEDLEELLNSEHVDQLYNANFPPNVANECRTAGNTFKLWLCNNELVGSLNQGTKAKLDRGNKHGDGSVPQDNDAGEDHEVFCDASLLTSPHDTVGTSTNNQSISLEGALAESPSPSLGVDTSNFATQTFHEPKTGNSLYSSTFAKSLSAEKSSKLAVENVESIKYTDASREEKESGSERVDKVTEAIEETITVQNEADLIHDHRCIHGDEDFLSVISQQSDELTSQNQEPEYMSPSPSLGVDTSNFATQTFHEPKTGNSLYSSTFAKSLSAEQSSKLAVENVESIKYTDASQEEKESGSERVDKVTEAIEETITVQNEADLIHDHRCIHGDEDFLSVISQQSDELTSQNQEPEYMIKDQENGWKTVSYRKKKAKTFPWQDTTKRRENTHVGDVQEKFSSRNRNNRKSKIVKDKIQISAEITSVKTELNKEVMMATDEIMAVDNIWLLSSSNRLRLYLFWVESYRERYRTEIQRGEQEYEQLCREQEAIRFEEEEEVIRRATVVGMTSSGAAKYHSMLQRVAPKVIVIEEAAEVMEANIITSLSHDTKHTILIGDHKQLCPKATVYELAQKYNLAISLFERMIMNGMDCKRLSIQHRMRPEIAALTKRIYDHEIVDHESVCELEDIAGVTNNLFFIDHCKSEILEGALQSYSNPHEADFLVALCKYLLLQGYSKNQITVLTMYTGQLLLFKEQMPRRTFEGVRVCAVNNFQGEENDIILLSLVRSNNERKIGFLKEPNRICVALSRARQGFYCIGNFNLLKSQSKLWQEICADLETKNAIGETLQLVCKKHNNVTNVRTSREFNEHGGCNMLCGDRLVCGHVCEMPCHVSDQSHGSTCGDCMVVVDMTIPECGHSVEMPCHIDPSSVRCKKPCERVRMCGHHCQNVCSKNCEALACNELVNTTLPCGHVVSLACHKDPDKYKCKEKVDVQLPCGHMKSLVCSTMATDLQNISCMVKMKRKLPCEHEVTLPCYRNPMEHVCKEKVEITLPCGHKKLTTCSEVRDGLHGVICDTKVTKILHCGHEKEMFCSEKPEEVLCDAPCERFLPCKHPCPKKCGDDCANVNCAVEVQKVLSCGSHKISCRCSDDVSQMTCPNECNRKLPCGHKCPGKCSEKCSQDNRQAMVVKHLDREGKNSRRMPCSDDSKAVTCQEPCDKNLDCGHPCPGLCSQPCGGMKCIHRVEKTFPCGHKEPLQCFQSKTATCTAPCQHLKTSCKHICKGVCGQDCSKYPCDVMVRKTLSCGHKIKVPCSLSADDVQCPAVCGAILPCGHQCSGTCDDCQQRGSHELCQHPCGRLLVCSHRCKATCSEPCPPCGRKCDRRCPHGKCKKRCSQMCEPCKKPCTWSCPHYQCNNLCWEECDRPRCNAPCPKKLPCRHPCLGLCGENCPTVCAVCHPQKLSSMLADGRGNKTEPTRCMQLFDCGHIVTVEEMDAWMARKLGSDVQLMRCPKCSTTITFSYRYGNLIKRALENVENVKKQVRDLTNEAADFVSSLVRNRSLLPYNVEMMKFPQVLLDMVMEISRRPSSMDVQLQMPVHIIPILFTLKNHFFIMRQAEKANRLFQYMAYGQVMSSPTAEQLEIKQYSRTSENALRKINEYLEKPQLDLKTLNQVYEHTRKIFLFSLILEAESKALECRKSFSSIGQSRLKLAHSGFHSFLEGDNEAFHLEWLERITCLLRNEANLPPVPPEETVPKDFENFPGFNRSAWKCCGQRHVYCIRTIVRDGEDVSVGSEGCSKCEEGDV